MGKVVSFYPARRGSSRIHSQTPGPNRKFFSLPLLVERMRGFFEVRKITRLERTAKSLRERARDLSFWAVKLDTPEFGTHQYDIGIIKKLVGLHKREKETRERLISLLEKKGDSVGARRHKKSIAEIDELIRESEGILQDRRDQTPHGTDGAA